MKEAETTDPVVGLWVSGDEVGLNSVYVYDLIHKFITSPMEKKCQVVCDNRGTLDFLLQIYTGSSPETYLLSIEECKPTKWS